MRDQLGATEAALALANAELMARVAATTTPPTAPADGNGTPAATGATATAGLPGVPAAGGPPTAPRKVAAPAANDNGEDGVDAFLSDFDDEGASSGDGEWAPTPRRAGEAYSRTPATGPGGHRGFDTTVDNFDVVKRPAAGDYLRSFIVPHDFERPDGMPVPFAPVDNGHATDFTAGSRDENEARQWYQVLAWIQQLHNDSLRTQHTRGLATSQHAAYMDFVTCSSRRIFSLGTARYDYLAMWHSEPALAESYAHADAIPRNGRRGEGVRSFLAGVVRQEAYASAKLGALSRGFAYGDGRGGRGHSSTAPAGAPMRDNQPVGAPPPRAPGGGRVGPPPD